MLYLGIKDDHDLHDDNEEISIMGKSEKFDWSGYVQKYVTEGLAVEVAIYCTSKG